MKLETVVQDGWIEYFWKNADSKVISPTFTKKTHALEWFTMHEEWIEDRDKNAYANLMYIKSNN